LAARLRTAAPAPYTTLFRSVLPAVAGDEVAAGIAQHGHAEFPDQLQHVAAEPVGVRARMLRLEDSRVDAASQVFGEGAEDAAARSEEHTSELQSREKLVCRL